MHVKIVNKSQYYFPYLKELCTFVHDFVRNVLFGKID